MKKNSNKRGNCYVTTEALFHLLGGYKTCWVPMRLNHEGDSHWFLMRKGLVKTLTEHSDTIDFWKKIIQKPKSRTVFILDLTARQFKTIPDYTKAKKAAFLTKKPSKRAKALMEQMIWQ